SRIGQFEGQRMRIIAPIGPVQMDAVPRYLRATRLGPVLAVAEYHRSLVKTKEVAYEAQDVSVLGNGVPVKPADLIVLAVGVIVAPLRAPHFVAHEQHRAALRHEQGRKEILYLLPAQSLNSGIVGRTFDAAVPTVVVARAVSIVFAVGL